MYMYTITYILTFTYMFPLNLPMCLIEWLTSCVCEGLELILGSLRKNPLHFGIKREVLEWTLAMITGRNAYWKVSEQERQ